MRYKTKSIENGYYIIQRKENDYTVRSKNTSLEYVYVR